MPSSMTKNTLLWYLCDSMSLMRRAAPRAFYSMISLNVLAGLVPSALVYLSAQLISRISAGKLFLVNAQIGERDA